ncbi:metallophosphoesterase [Streptomyces sp. NBC_01298]|uniref:metallophosphoesterase family protein n=1 Tax=Streptomyces sp. NBC_01298 TaxID=2903817 RepID=UPI002E0D59F2|nr:metallophosphoesterase [Streptomyces sp. NBC_01298]
MPYETRGPARTPARRPGAGVLAAISDLHVHYPENRRIVADLRPESDEDWLIVAGDVGEVVDEIAWALELLAARFAKVVWVPGNHELWTPREDPVQLRGERRYHHLVELCRSLGVVTPEDPYPVWDGEDGPLVIAPLFLLYDYTFRQAGTTSKEDALERAEAAGVVCSDEFLLDPEPYGSRDTWCRARVAYTEARLAALPPDARTVLVNHFPLVRDPTEVLWKPEFALWCGTEATADWHRRFRAAAVVYGHLHIPRTILKDGVPFEEVSLGYPREWRGRAAPAGRPVRIRPAAPAKAVELT